MFFVAGLTLIALLFCAGQLPAQTFSVIHNFTGNDGGHPYGNIAIDRGGSLYGSTYYYGPGNGGTVFKLMRHNSSWLLNTLHNFNGGLDGANNVGGITIGPNGSLYGTTESGGTNGLGIVFNLKPPLRSSGTVLAPWTEKVLYNFAGPDGADPYSTVTFDQGGSMYGVTHHGGLYDLGVIFQLSPNGSSWTEQVIHYFAAGIEGTYPAGPPAVDGAGNLYFTTGFGGENGGGGVAQMTHSGQDWAYNVLYSFSGSSGFSPRTGVIVDNSGRVIGATFAGGSGGGGTVFSLTPGSGSWDFNLLYSLSGPGEGGPYAPLTIDSAGNLYGTTSADGSHQQGSVFKLNWSNDHWTYADLYDFTGGADGGSPSSNVVLDANGNLYGTAVVGGSNSCSFGCGVVWQITP